MIEAGFYGTHDESHPEGLAPGMPSATSHSVLALPGFSCGLGQTLPADIKTSSTVMHKAAAALGLTLCLVAISCV